MIDVAGMKSNLEILHQNWICSSPLQEGFEVMGWEGSPKTYEGLQSSLALGDVPGEDSYQMVGI